MAVKYDSDLEIFRSLCERVSVYYTIERYPDLIDAELAREEVEKNIEEAKRLIKALFGEDQ